MDIGEGDGEDVEIGNSVFFEGDIALSADSSLPYTRLANTSSFNACPHISRR